MKMWRWVLESEIVRLESDQEAARAVVERMNEEREEKLI